MSPREGPSRPKFGRIDPYCLMAVLPVLLVAGIIGSLVNVALGLGCAAFAGLILLFDSWANRPSRAPEETGSARPEPEPRPVRRTAPPTAQRTQVARAQAPRAQAPRAQAPRGQAPRGQMPPRGQLPRPQAPRARQAPGGAPYR